MSTNNFPFNGSPAACKIPSILTNSLAASKKQAVQPQMTLDSAFLNEASACSISLFGHHWCVGC